MSPVEGIPHRRIDQFVKLQLFVRSGGRCELNGHNKYLLEHQVALRDGNFAEMAHVVAFKEGGPRGAEGERPADINAVENLMLLCPECHKLIDDNPGEYPRQALEAFKREHEERIANVTSIGPDQKTATLRVTAPIRGQAVAISQADVFSAVLPRYPMTLGGSQIDLGNLAGQRETGSFYDVARTKIDRDIDRLFAQGAEAERAHHLSVFALAPIPLLVHLGAKLSNKVPTDVFQRHRDTENWSWKVEGPIVGYRVSRRQAGPEGAPVALVLPLSGSIPTDRIPEPLKVGTIYEVALDRAAPDPTFLRRREDLDGFRVAFQQVLGRIAEDNGLLPAIHLIPAIPAPIAVLCGRERLPKVHPALRVYDYDHANGGYTFAFEVQ